MARFSICCNYLVEGPRSRSELRSLTERVAREIKALFLPLLTDGYEMWAFGITPIPVDDTELRRRLGLWQGAPVAHFSRVVRTLALTGSETAITTGRGLLLAGIARSPEQAWPVLLDHDNVYKSQFALLFSKRKFTEADVRKICEDAVIPTNHDERFAIDWVDFTATRTAAGDVVLDVDEDWEYGDLAVKAYLSLKTAALIRD